MSACVYPPAIMTNTSRPNYLFFFLLFNKTRTSVVSNFTAVGIKELIIRVQDTPDVQMNRYIDIHELNARVPHLPERQNHDVHVNT